MNKCLNCQKETKNPKYCSCSCAAKMNNIKFPKREGKGKCKICNCTTTTRRKYCVNCKKSYKIPRKIIVNQHDIQNDKYFCAKCMVFKDKTEYSLSKHTKFGIKTYCKECYSKFGSEKQRLFKLNCVKYKGDKCQKCGYNKYIGALEFHHIDPSQKDFNISHAKNKTINDKIKKELDKCILLCSNCHREEHDLAGTEGIAPST